MTVEQTKPGGGTPTLPVPPPPSLESQADPDGNVAHVHGDIVSSGAALVDDRGPVRVSEAGRELTATALARGGVVHHESMVVREEDLFNPATRARLAEMLERTAAAAVSSTQSLEGRVTLSEEELVARAMSELTSDPERTDPPSTADIAAAAAELDRNTRHPQWARRRERRHAPESGADGPVDPVELRRAALEVLRRWDAEDLVADVADAEEAERVGAAMASLRDALRGRRP